MAEKIILLEKIKEYLEQLTFLFPCHAYWKDSNGIYLGCNDRYSELAGLDSALSIIGSSEDNLPWVNQTENLNQIELTILKTGEPYQCEEVLIFPNDKKLTFISHRSAIYNKEKEIIGILCVLFEISKYKKQENDLQVLQDQTQIALENILNNIPAHIFWKNRDCVLLGCNDRQAKNMGFTSAAEMVGKSNYDVINPNQSKETRKAQADAITKHDQEVMRTGQTFTIEEPLVLADGTTAIYLSKKAPLRNTKGEIVGVLGISFDITDKKRIEQELQETRIKLDGMNLVVATIAHELRTPLAALNLGLSSLNDYIPNLMHAYKLAERADLPIQRIKPSSFHFLNKVISSMQYEVRAAFTFIDIHLMNVNPIINQSGITLFSIVSCVNEALMRYPFQEGQRELVNWDYGGNDFVIKTKSVLIAHVLFNLIKNALYYIADANKGEIHIWLEPGLIVNKLHFKDTGMGISEDILPNIFDRFFTKTHHGTGIGLTFCKMVMENLGGKISCESVEGSYTHFILFFPSISE